MTKLEIMALMMRKESQFKGNTFMLAARLVICLEPRSERMQDGELAELIQTGSVICYLSVEQYKESVLLEDLFPACENWSCPHPDRGGFRH